ncbi:MAG TPA: type II toxin-antitoxin system HicB family antitoxin [Candidatus Rifleibacterium sp.]|nr:type II toxin-antitoxin system HicB family antitoxin [Candidatus Rifleibacterium sp.]
MKKKSGNYRFPIIVEKDSDGYFAYCHNIQGCYAQGETYDEVLKNIREVIKLHLEESLANGEPVTRSDEVLFTTLDIAV